MDYLDEIGAEHHGEQLVGNTIPSAVTKLLTLIPIVVAVYYFDFSKFLTVLTTAGQGAFFVVATSLFVLGIVLKRKILRARLELSRVSFTWGLTLLFVAAFLYIYGSYSANGVWYHYESFCMLIFSYVALRMGTGILRALVPLLVILTLAFPLVGFFPGLNDRTVVVLLSSDLMFVFFLAFVGLRVKALVVPTAVLLLGLLGWYKSPVLLSGHQVSLLFLIPVPLVLLLVPRIRRFVLLPTGAPTLACSEHHILSDGFCSMCGLKLARAKTTENFGLWGLLAVVTVAVLLILAAVPVLALIGGVPYDAYYTSHGYSGTVTPSTPPGWQINSTARYTLQTDTYAIKQVYVPIFHPETKNYTMYYELSTIAPAYVNTTFGEDIPGWSINNTADNGVQLGPFSGHLTRYVSSNRVMLTYQGETSMLFLNGSTFVEYSVSLGFVRVFTNPNLTTDTAQFLGDLNGLWLPAITADLSLSGWTSFLDGLDQGVSSISQFALLASSVVALIWVTYRASFSDERLDRFVAVAPVQPEEYWSYLSGLLKLPHHTGTGQELAADLDASASQSSERLDSVLQQLQYRHLVGRSLVERGADIIFVWKAMV